MKRLSIIFILIIISLFVYYYKNHNGQMKNYYSEVNSQNLTYYQENSLDYIMNHQQDFYNLGYKNEDINKLIFTLSYDRLRDVLDQNIKKSILIPYLQFSNFNFTHLNSYEQIRKTNNISQLEAINRYHHPNMTSGFYEHIGAAINPHTPLVLVNKNYILKKDYTPSQLVSIKDLPLVIREPEQNRNKVMSVTYDALKDMFRDARKSGVFLLVSSGYRSFSRQDVVYNYYLLEGGMSYADRFSARPGHSEHQTGYAVDVTCEDVNYGLVEAFEDTPEGQWIEKHAHLYGFIIRYPKNNESSTGYNYEPWHLRYVGKDVATIIYKEDIILEEYLLKYTELKN